MKIIGVLIAFVVGVSCSHSPQVTVDVNGSTTAASLPPTVEICGQTWMARNLDVAAYRNGDPIPQVTDSTAWVNLKTGAWCWYNNDSAANAATYGRLYNWY